MKNRTKTTKNKRAVCTGESVRLTAFLLACLLAVAAMSVGALAGNPEFSRSEEEWAILRDNILEWTEIDSLITEYNATVEANRTEYTENKLSGKNASQTSDVLNSMAETYEALAIQMEGTTGGAVTAASYRVMADQLRSQADENVSDYRIILLENERVRMEIVKSAKLLFLGYHRAVVAKDQNEKQLAFTEKKYKSAVNLQKWGMGTEVETLTALENYQKAQAEAQTSDSNINTNYRKLITLCGWQYDADAVIGPLPERDAETVAATDRDVDLKKALDNSITLKSDAIKLENAQKLFGGSVVNKWKNQLAADTNTVKSSYDSARDALALAKLNYDSALSRYRIKAANLVTAGNQLAQGTIAKIDYTTVENEADTAEAELTNAWIGLLEARAAYDAIVDGLS